MKHDQERTEGDSAPNMLENLGDGPRKGEYRKHDRREGEVNWEALIGVKAGSADMDLVCGAVVQLEAPRWAWSYPGTGVTHLP